MDPEALLLVLALLMFTSLLRPMFQTPTSYGIRGEVLVSTLNQLDQHL